MNPFIVSLNATLAIIKSNLTNALIIVSFFWVVFFVNVMSGYRLNILGIYPRHILGLIGLFFYTFLHASFNHLFFNSIPLFVLVTFMLSRGYQTFLCASISIILLAGIAIWFFGRRAIHIGASSLVMGYWGYLLMNAYQYPSMLTLLVAIICVYYFGGLLLNLFPTEEKVSWEGHLLGFLSGIATVYLCPFTLQ